MVDLLGPADAGAINTLTTTTDVTAPVADDSWFEDCAGGASGTGTPLVAKYLNRVLQQLRAAVRASGVPQANSYDEMLSWAIQSGFANWLQSGFGGTANALTGAAPNNPLAIEGGTVVCGVVGSGLTNTEAATFDWAGLGAQPIVTIDGQPLSGGEYHGSYFLILRWDGGAWRIVSPPPLAWYGNLFKINVQSFLTSGTWTAPAPGFAASSRVIIEVWGAGAGGGSGSGGGGGAYERFETYLGLLPSSGAVVIGAGGAGTTTTDLVPGTAGGASTFLYGWFNNVFSAAGGAPIDNGTVNNGGAGVLFPAGTGGAGGQWYPDGAGVDGQSVNFGGGGGGGAQGTGAANYTAAGTSTFGGAGGAAPGGAGSQPGGGGGASDSTSVSGAAGGPGKVVVTVIQGG